MTIYYYFDIERMKRLNEENNSIGLHQLKHYMSEIRVYIISGLSADMQEDVFSLLRANTCINMLEEHMEGTLYEHLMDIAIESGGDVILTNTKSVELIDSYIDAIEELAELWRMRIYICCNDNVCKLNKLYEKVKSIALFNISGDENKYDIYWEDKVINING